MAAAVSDSLKSVEWMWKSNQDPDSSEVAKWSHYSDVENLIIERAYQNNESRALLDDYYIDLKQDGNALQVSNKDSYRQRPVQRVVRKREDKHLRESRFMDLPVSTSRSFGNQYGWVSPFIIEVRRELGLKMNELPSKQPHLIPILVEKAAEGIIMEGINLGKQREAEKIASDLLETKHKAIEEVWKCCAYLYSLESFLYKTLNAAMRTVGSEEELFWRCKVRTLGPFCLLLWDDPLNQKLTTKKILYRGASLTTEQINAYKELAKNKDAYGSFPSFSSCSRNRTKAEEFGNVLFIMKVNYAFIADLSQYSEYSNEEEDLITPGVCFRVECVKFNLWKYKYFIYLELRQRFDASGHDEVRGPSNQSNDEYDPRLRRLLYFDRDGNFL